MTQEELMLKNHNNWDDEDEIDLYEVVHILIKNLWIIVLTTILFTGLGFGFAKLKSEKVLNKELLIINPSINIRGLNTIEPTNVFLQNNNINVFFTNPEVKNKYEESVPKENQNIHSQRRFVKDLFVINHDKKTNHVSLHAKLIKDGATTEQIMQTYIVLLKNQDNTMKALVAEKASYKTQVDALKSAIDGSTEKTLGDFPIFNKYLELNSYSPISRIKETSDFYLTTKDNTMKFTGVAFVLGGVIGVILAFLKEFFDEYRRRYCKK